MSAQTIWFALAVLLVIGELMTGTFYLLMVAVGLLAGGLAALSGLAFPTQAIVAAIVAVFGIIGLRRTRYGRVTRENAARNGLGNCEFLAGDVLKVVDELEEKAKRGEVISLSALAAAVKAEDGRTPQRDPDGKKPSIRAQLKADRVQSGKPQQREKEQEAKRSIRQALEME